MGNFPEKIKEERLNNKSKAEIEKLRRLAEAEKKMAGALIEEIERTRKRPIIISLQRRIKFFVKQTEITLEIIDKNLGAGQMMNQGNLEELKNLLAIHDSIYADFMYSVDDKGIDLLFPKIECQMGDTGALLAAISKALAQEFQMGAYLLRKVDIE